MQKLQDLTTFEVGLKVGKYEAYCPISCSYDMSRLERALRVYFSYYFPVPLVISFSKLRGRSVPLSIVSGSRTLESFVLRMVSLITNQINYGKIVTRF